METNTIKNKRRKFIKLYVCNVYLFLYVKVLFFFNPSQIIIVSIITLWKLLRHGIFPLVRLANVSIS